MIVLRKLYEDMDRKNDVLWEDSTMFNYFKRYLLEQEYEEIVALGEWRETGRYDKK